MSGTGRINPSYTKYEEKHSGKASITKLEEDEAALAPCIIFAIIGCAMVWTGKVQTRVFTFTGRHLVLANKPRSRKPLFRKTSVSLGLSRSSSHGRLAWRHYQSAKLVA